MSADSVTVPARKLASWKHQRQEEPLPVGSSLIASPEDGSDDFFGGLVLEPPTKQNRNRYLVFFGGDGSQYISSRRIRQIFDDPGRCIKEYRHFITTYRRDYPHHEMVEVRAGDMVRVKMVNVSRKGTVLEVDCSVAKVKVTDKRRTLGESEEVSVFRVPYFIKKRTKYDTVSNLKTANSINSVSLSSFPTRPASGASAMNMNSVSSRPSASAISTNANSAPASGGIGQSVTVNVPTANQISSVRAVARKSTAGRCSAGEPVFYPVEEITLPRSCPTPLALKRHTCSPSCISRVQKREREEPLVLDGPEPRREVCLWSPLVYPLLHGWRRKHDKRFKPPKVIYTTPCGEAYEKTEDIFQYLQKVESNMTIDMFDIHLETRPFARLRYDKERVLKRDLSEGMEKVPITVFNSYDDSLPEPFQYCTTYSGANDPDPNSLVTCDCKDGCRDEGRCFCSRVTLQEIKKMLPRSTDSTDQTYCYRRLFEKIGTGIYECNERCKCSSSCLNKVVQNPLSLELQVFKTQKKGWGVRCLHDIPLGAFICTYAGDLLTDAQANIEGKTNGDRYLLELDHRNIAEKVCRKEGYESDVEYDFELGSDVEDVRGTEDSLTRPIGKRRMEEEPEAGRKRRKVSADADDTVSSDIEAIASTSQPLLIETRNFVVNGKYKGNVSRFFNHSCEPNLFVQNVFTDTHDLRFPKVAFFAAVYIPAGQELTWYYGYGINTVAGQNMKCKCGSSKCSGRLL